MASYEHKGQLNYVDEGGNEHILYPETEIDCVLGLNEELGAKAPISHTEDKNNPHEVTAEQVGARPSDWTPTAVEVGARPYTWMPTAEDVGAAPAGYGLGESYCKRVNSVEDITKSGYYIVWLDTNNGDPVNGNYTFHAIADAIYDNVHLQCKVGGGYLHRDKWDGTWQPWEWVNPPMNLGVEYRTTERWNGKVVYTKLVNYGGLPNYTTYTVAHGCAATCVLRYCAVNETLGMAIPNSTTSITVDKNSISLTTNTTDVKGNIARVQIWYTKD